MAIRLQKKWRKELQRVFQIRTNGHALILTNLNINMEINQLKSEFDSSVKDDEQNTRSYAEIVTQGNKIW